MGTVQTTFALNRAVAAPGILFGDIHTALRESRLAAAQVSFGTFVARRASPADGVDQCANPAATADVTARGLGFAIYDETRNGQGYVLYAPVSYLRKGYMWVPCETACVEGVQPFIRFAAGAGGSLLGKVRNDADTATAVQYGTPAIIFRNTLAAAGLALVEVNLPG